MPDQLRLQVYLAKCGIASRRKCEEIIAQGRVSVNGKVVIVPGTKVEEDDIVTYDGRKISQAKKKIYIALHKPSKFLCSTKDPDDRPLAIDLITPIIKQRLFYVGRLDYLTSGLIFFTNDGDFSKKMTHPSTHIEKEYVVTTKDPIPLELMEEFKKGIYVLGERFKMKDFEFKGNRCVHIILEEGKNRELRKVFLSRNISVKKVHRIRIGSIELKGIHSGHLRKLTEREVKSLLKTADAKGEGLEANRARKKSISHVKTVEKQTQAIQKEKDDKRKEYEEQNPSPKIESRKRSFSDNDSRGRDFSKKPTDKRSFSDNNSRGRDFSKRPTDKRSFSDNDSRGRDFSKKPTDKRSFSDNDSRGRDFSKKPTDKRSFSDNNSRGRDFNKKPNDKRSFSDNNSRGRDFTKKSSGKRSYSDNESRDRDPSKKSSSKRSFSDNFSKKPTDKRSFSDNNSRGRDFTKKSTGKRSYSDNESRDRDSSKKSSGKRNFSDNNSSGRDFKKSSTGKRPNSKNFNNRGNK